MSSGIYKILNTKNGKFYVGSTVNLNRRFIVHKSQLRRNIHVNFYLQNAWNKYSAWLFEFQIIELCEKSNLVKREQHYINTLKPEYNLCPIAGSPSFGKPLSKEHKENISKSLKGTKHSDESRARMSAWQVGRKMSDEAKRNMTIAKTGTAYRRMKDKWPCSDGWKCKCKDCKAKKKAIKQEWDKNNYVKIPKYLDKRRVENRPLPIITGKVIEIYV